MFQQQMMVALLATILIPVWALRKRLASTMQIFQVTMGNPLEHQIIFHYMRGIFGNNMQK
jgi:hypothetical protein